MRLKKKHFIYIIAAAVCIILALIVVFGTKNRMVESDLQKDAEYTTADDSAFSDVSGEVRLENERFLFTMDAATTHFTISDKTTGVSYSSVNRLSDEENASGLYGSEIAVDYYDTNNQHRTLYSFENSVAYESFQVKSSGDTVRVYYDVKETKDDIFIPTVLTKENFEENILKNLGAGQKRRIIRYYKLRNAEDNKDLLSRYPELKNQELYIVIDTMNAADQKEVTECFKTAGYTREQYTKDTADMEITEIDIDLPAQFMVPVEYKLTEKGFEVKLLSDRISSVSDDYTLSEIQVLPMFGSIAEESEGYFFVPDGSGALVSFRDQVNSTFNIKVYGNDDAVDREQNSQIAQRPVMPVYGMNRGDSGFFAIIEGAAECATVKSQVLGDSNLSTAIYTGFLLRSYDETSIAAYSMKTSLNIYAKEMVSEIPSVQYMLLGKDDCDYSSMAKRYREYLIEQGVLTERLQEGETLYLDFTGYVSEQATFLGVPYDDQIILSTVDHIGEVVTGLYDEGITDLSVRLKGYSHSGLRNSVMDSFEITSDIGNKKNIRSLADLLKENGGLLYLEDTVDVVYDDSVFDGFDKVTHAAKRINQMPTKRGDYNLVISGKKYIMNNYYVVSPRYYEYLTSAFIDSFEKKMGTTEEYGYSWSGYGNHVTGDYRKTDVIDRAEARKYADSAVSLAEGFAGIMTEGGNMYALAQVDTILNVPLSDSAYDVVTEGVPFYQMVIHGYKNYAGAALNIAADSEKEWLKTIECGASIYYSCMTENYTKIKDMNYRQTLYPITEELSHDEIVSRYQEYQGVFARLATQVMEHHEITEDGLHLTTYEDGTVVAVNYENHAIKWNDITVEAKSFAVAERQEEQ